MTSQAYKTGRPHPLAPEGHAARHVTTDTCGNGNVGVDTAVNSCDSYTAAQAASPLGRRAPATAEGVRIGGNDTKIQCSNWGQSPILSTQRASAKQHALEVSLST